ncbi:MAG: hypothetical protein K0R38_7712, partial [Polyangiaceae bacterium]|nr:hypothetical protein [Polyangiaceae bacterium]
MERSAATVVSGTTGGSGGLGEDGAVRTDGGGKELTRLCPMRSAIDSSRQISVGAWSSSSSSST